MGAMFFQVPELMLEEADAKKLADALAAVSEQYRIELDPKTAAWIDFARVTGMIYGPRTFNLYARKKGERIIAKRQRPAPIITPAPAPSTQTSDVPETIEKDQPAQVGKMPAGFDPTKLKIH